jgi:magnesium transporter
MPAGYPLPGSLIDLNTNKETGDRRIFWTTSLPLVLAQLDLASKKSGRYHRPRHRQKGAFTEQPTAVEASHPLTQELLEIRSPSISPVRFSSPWKAGKGKQRETQVGNGKPKHTPVQEEPSSSPAWFLDVANPTWADLRAIGKVRHLSSLEAPPSIADRLFSCYTYTL